MKSAAQWFGDWSRMASVNGLWPNEAFATFMEMPVDMLRKPEWERWTPRTAPRRRIIGGMGPVSIGAGEFPCARRNDPSFDVLTYEKGASVLSQCCEQISVRRVPGRRTPLPWRTCLRGTPSHRPSGLPWPHAAKQQDVPGAHERMDFLAWVSLCCPPRRVTLHVDAFTQTPVWSAYAEALSSGTTSPALRRHVGRRQRPCSICVIKQTRAAHKPDTMYCSQRVREPHLLPEGLDADPPN